MFHPGNSSRKGKKHAPKKADAANGNTHKEEWYMHSEMLDQRIIRLDGEIDTSVAANICASIHYLEKKDPTKPILLLINSPGGSVSDGLAIIDTIRNCQCPVHTCVYGLAASMASVILTVGNKRYASPNAEIMIHQPWGGAEGQSTELDIGARDMRNTRETLTQIYAEETGLDHADIDKLLERDYTMSSDRALKLGFVDEIMTQELYFKLSHGKKVPEYKKPRYPNHKRKDTRKSIEEEFNEIADKAAANRKPAPASNDNTGKADKKKKGDKPPAP